MMACITFVILLSLMPVALAQTCSSITAAFRVDDGIHLFFGTKYKVFRRNTYKRTSFGEVDGLFGGMPRIPVDAVYHPVLKPELTIVASGDKFYRIKDGSVLEGPVGMNSKFRRNTFFATGIDAAATQNKKTYYFKGCIILRKAYNGFRHLSTTRSAGLPCNVDAAWSDRNRILVTKGPFTWEVDMESRTSKFTSFYFPPTTTAPV